MPGTNASDHAAAATDTREVDAKLLEILVCPMTKGTLVYDQKSAELISRQAGLAYPVRDGVPIMLVDAARELDDDPPVAGRAVSDAAGELS